MIEKFINYINDKNKGRAWRICFHTNWSDPTVTPALNCGYASHGSACYHLLS